MSKQLLVILGAHIFVALERPDEEIRYSNKREAAIEIDKNIDFLAEVFFTI